MSTLWIGLWFYNALPVAIIIREVLRICLEWLLAIEIRVRLGLLADLIVV